MNNNIFVVGTEVRDESQIGYRRYIDDFTKKLLNTRNNISITGLNRIGKTSIAKTVLRKIKENAVSPTLVLYINLARQKSYSHLLDSIVRGLKNEILKNNYKDLINDEQYKMYMDEIIAIKPEAIEFRIEIEFILQRIKEMGYKIILAIDEFDSASYLFKDTPDYEFFRDLSSNSDIGVSLLLISRRQLYMIEKKNFNNSTFHGIVQTNPINGFNEEDFALFYNLLKNKYDITLNDDDKEKLKYYCGRSPYLVSMFAYEIVDSTLKNSAYDIDDIYERKAIDIGSYYNHILDNLSNDKINVEGAVKKSNTIEKLVGIILGPKIDIIEKDITMLKSMGYLYTDGEKYLSISQYFTNNDLRNYPLQVKTWDEILGLEKFIKSMIRKQIMTNKKVECVTYDIWEEVFITIGAADSLGRYDKFVEDSMKNYKKYYIDVLEVCSFDIAVSILQYYWGWFIEYFNCDEWNKWEEKLRLCAKARDPMAHGHEEFLSPEARSCVNSYCREIKEILKNNNACLDRETEMKIEYNTRISQLRKSYYENKYDNVDKTLVGKQAVFFASVQDSKGIKGYVNINSQCFKCTNMGKQKWEKCYPGTKLSDCLGKSYKVTISTVNEPQNIVGCEFI